MLLFETGIIYANTGVTLLVERAEKCTEALACPAAL